MKKCGENQSLIISSRYLAIYNYRKNIILKIIITLLDHIYLWNFYIINENIIIFTKYNNNKCRIYDISKDKFFDNNNINFVIDDKNTSKIGQNLFISFAYGSKEMIQWTYNYELNKINILSRKENNFINVRNIEYYFNDNKLYILKKGESEFFGINNLYIDVFKLKCH